MNAMLTQLKAIAETRIKGYSDPIPDDQIINIIGLGGNGTIEQFIVSYVKENTPMGVQKVLAISRDNGSEYQIDDHIKSIVDQFDSISPISFVKNFPNRGFTHMFVWNV